MRSRGGGGTGKSQHLQEGNLWEVKDWEPALHSQRKEMTTMVQLEEICAKCKGQLNGMHERGIKFLT